MSDQKRLSVPLPIEHYEALKIIAASQDRPMSYVAGRALIDWVEAAASEHPEAALIQTKLPLEGRNRA